MDWNWGPGFRTGPPGLERGRCARAGGGQGGGQFGSLSLTGGPLSPGLRWQSLIMHTYHLSL